MGLLKAAAKIVGTATLLATGTASAVLKTVADTAGVDLGSEVFGAAKDASFNGIRSMWGGEISEDIDEKLSDYEVSSEDTARRKMAQTAKRAADLAKKNGDMEKYEKYMEQYERYR